MFNRRFIQVVVLLVTLLGIVPDLSAGHIKHIVSRAGVSPNKPLQKTSPAVGLQLFDQEYQYMVAHPLSSGTPWTNTFAVPFLQGSSTERDAYCNVVLRYDESRFNLHGSAWNIEVFYDIKCWEWNQGTGSFSTNTYTSKSIKIDYDPAAPYTDIALDKYKNTFGAQVTITDVKLNGTSIGSGNLASVYNDVFLDLEQETERYYVLSQAPTVSRYDYTSTNETEIRWNFVPGAESYDLEWVFIDVDDDPSPSTTGVDRAFDFHNATRVNVPDQYYRISLAFPKGILLYRVRAVAAAPLTADDYSLYSEGPWSFYNSSYSGTTLSNAPYSPGTSESYRREIDGLHPHLNWQYAASFAEDGKRKEVISFFDASLRNRQTLTILNTEKYAVIGESKYDYSGRAAVQIMPAPVASSGIRFYNNFNPNFDRTDFDQDANVANPGQLSSTSGAGYYYSSSNTNPIGYNGGYTPDAEGYAYSRTRFATDGTNRPVSVSSPGPTHHTGSGRETKFIYGSPSSQDEIDRLFGNEAGSSTHYQKNAVVDANGQVSVAYIDQYGRTVATALGGNTPTNLIAVDNQPQAQTYTANLLSQSNEMVNSEAMVSSVDIMCLAPNSVYTFDYDLSSSTYCNNCFICQTCMYDLEISVLDEYGNYVTGATINSSSCSVSTGTNPIRCTGISNGSYNFSITLGVGKYKVVKRLALSESSVDQYEAEYTEYQQEHFTCPPVNPIVPASCNFACEDMCTRQFIVTDDNGVVHYFDDQGAEITQTVNGESPADQAQGFINVCINSNCGWQQQPLSECDLKLKLLMMDMSPGGQYFENEASRFISGSNGDLIDNPNYDSNAWLTSHVSNNANFSWTAFTTAANNYTGECAGLSVTLNDWDDVRANWCDSFAVYLVQFHPEYCQFNYFCRNVLCTKDGSDIYVNNSNLYNDYLLTVNDETAAEGGGLFSTFGHATSTTHNWANDYSNGNTVYMPYSDSGVDPYFDCNPVNPVCAENVSDLIEMHLSHFYPIPYTSNYFNIWYVINDPDNIHAGSASLSPVPDAATIAYFQMLHGDGTSSNIGILHDPASGPIQSGQIERWMFYRATYMFYKNLLHYSGVYSTGNCPNGFLADSDQDGYTDITIANVLYKGFQIRYPENPLYEIYTDNANDILCTADPQTASGYIDTYNTNLVQSTCASTCEGYAESWVLKIEENCTVDPNVRADFANCLAEVCKLDCGVDHPQGTSGCSTCPGTPCNTSCIGYTYTDPNNNQFTFYNFDQVVAHFTGNACSTVLVHPLTGDEASCSCNQLTNFIEANFTGTYTYQDVADLLNQVYATSYTATDIGNWIGECNQSVPSSTDLGNLSYPEFFTCYDGSNITPDYNPGVCECQNITQFISTTGYDPYEVGDMTRIVAALNTLLGPSTTVTSTDVQGWLNECAGISPSVSTLETNYHLPALLKCPVPASLDNDVVTGTAALAQCQQGALFSALNAAMSQYTLALQQSTADYVSGLRTNCLNNLVGRETFTVTYTQNEYLYTLYYYDQAGNLVKTVSPEGVDLLNNSGILQVQDYRQNPQTGAPKFPEHRLVTRYKYNSLQQLIESESPDGGLTKYWYDALGRPVLSQNARQREYDNTYYGESGEGYSYVKYDDLGRVEEGGELIHATSQPMTNRIARDLDPSISLDAWMNASTGYREITYMYYDEEHNSSDITSTYGNNWQEHLRNRVATVWYIKDPTANHASGPDAAEYYSYDIHGNVKRMVTETNVYDRLHYLGENLKETSYEYDLVSGNVNEVHYQEGQYDQFFHRYAYDADNRLVRAYTSHNGQIWEKEQKLFYYAHGPVARVETGDKQVQGQDYAYTILGWIKGVNSTTLDESRDIGKDGKSGSNLNRWFGRDAYGYSLGYFTNDYKAINTTLNNTSNSFTPVETTQTNDYVYNSYDLYNGNISRMVSVMRDASGNAIPVLARSFRYDQLNRIKEANAYGDNNVVTNNYWSTSGTNDLNSNYQEIFTYDWNGNIKTAQRNGNLSGTHQQMDNMSYWYDYDANGKLENNKLEKATDAATALAADYGNDIDAGQASSNYQYDEVGNLIADASEEIGKIEWNNQGKIAKITRTNGSTKADLEFLYNANGQRLAKIVKPRTGGNASTEEQWEYTVYGGGSIYELNYSGSGSNWTLNYDLKEQMVEGGISYDQQAAVTRTFNGTANSNSMFDLVPQNTFTGTTQVPTVSSTHQERKLGNKLYELANHLGNVMSTVSDRRISIGTGVVVNYYLPEVASYADYYAFGSTMSGRVWQGATKYRYGFNGVEKNDEMFEGAYSTDYREYDSRLGRWTATDPVVKPWESPYAGFANNPVYYVDPSGLNPGSNGPPDKTGNEKAGDKASDDEGNNYIWNSASGEWDGTVNGQQYLAGDELRTWDGLGGSWSGVKIENLANEFIFSDSKAQAHPYWAEKGIDQATFLSEVDQRFKNSYYFRQNGTGYCGMAALIHFWAKDHPEEYRQLMFDLYYRGEGTINGWTISIPTSGSMDQGDLPDADYVLFTSIRATLNGGYIGDSEAMDFYMPQTISKAAKKMGYTKGGWKWDLAPGKAPSLIDVDKYHIAGGHAILIINTRMLGNSNFNPYSNHYVGYEGGLHPTTNAAGQTMVNFTIFTWGRSKGGKYGAAYQVSVTTETFLKNYYGAILFK